VKAFVYVCDRCDGREEQDNLARVTVREARGKRPGPAPKTREYDLCATCVVELIEIPLSKTAARR
jgi:hypothetical protein